MSDNIIDFVNEWTAKVYAESKYDPFYSTSEWKKLRCVCFKKANYRCLRCDKRFRIHELSAHHLIPRAQGGSDNLHNLVCLCHACHDYVETHGYKTRAAIVGSMTYVVLESELQPPPKEQEDWHAVVYGGKRDRKHLIVGKS